MPEETIEQQVERCVHGWVNQLWSASTSEMPLREAMQKVAVPLVLALAKALVEVKDFLPKDAHMMKDHIDAALALLKERT